MSNVDSNIDVNAVVGKLQARLGEAMTVIAVLESQLEAARGGQQEAPAPDQGPVQSPAEVLAD